MSFDISEALIYASYLRISISYMRGDQIINLLSKVLLYLIIVEGIVPLKNANFILKVQLELLNLTLSLYGNTHDLLELWLKQLYLATFIVLTWFLQARELLELRLKLSYLESITIIQTLFLGNFWFYLSRLHLYWLAYCILFEPRDFAEQSLDVLAKVLENIILACHDRVHVFSLLIDILLHLAEFSRDSLILLIRVVCGLLKHSLHAFHISLCILH